MATAVAGNSGRNRIKQFSRIEKLFNEAQLTGDLNLSGRKFKEFPKVPNKYDLDDTVFVDLSRNRLSEVPIEICDYVFLERLDCYHNVIRYVPDCIVQLQCVTHINLSRNQLATIPPSLCHLQSLQILTLCHNKLVSLPEEIIHLQKLMDLDVSCNEISHLPLQIGNLTSLRSLNLRRNHLVELPVELTTIHLVRLDVSSNRIEKLPTRLRYVDSLMELILDNNPLSIPSSYLCTRGKVHVFKFLDIQAQKEDRKRGMVGMDVDYRRSQRRSNHSLDHSMNGLLLDNRYKRHTLDSCYGSSDGIKRWSQDSPEVTNENGTLKRYPMNNAEHMKDKRPEFEKEQKNTSTPTNPSSYQPYESSTNGTLVNTSLSNSRSPNPDVCFENEINREVLRQNNHRHLNRSIEEEEDDSKDALLAKECRKTAAKILEQQREESKKNSSQRNCVPPPPPPVSSILGLRDPVNACVTDATAGSANGGCPQSLLSEWNNPPFAATHNQTYREYKEALRVKRGGDNNIYRRVQAETGAGMIIPDGMSKIDASNFPRPPPAGAPSPNHLISEPEYSNCQTDGYSQQQKYEAQLALMRAEEEKRKQKQLQKEAVLSYVKSRTSPLRCSTDSDHCSSEDFGSKSSSPSLSPCPLPPPPLTITTTACLPGVSNVAKLSPHSPPPVNGAVYHSPRQRSNVYTIPRSTNSHLSHTLRRESERLRDEKEKIEQLRQAIEVRLKVSLPEDLASALTDGVVLCHLANHVRPRSVASIHVPSPAVPKLTVAKCRRNVENFLEACRRIGVAEEHLCSCDDILNGLPDPQSVLRTVEHLTKRVGFNKLSNHVANTLHSPTAVVATCCHANDVYVSWFCMLLFVGSCALLYLLPESA